MANNDPVVDETIGWASGGRDADGNPVRRKITEGTLYKGAPFAGTLERLRLRLQKIMDAHDHSDGELYHLMQSRLTTCHETNRRI